MDREKIIYDLSLAYAKEYLRRLNDQQLLDFGQFAGKVYGTFETARECFQEVVPTDVGDK